MEESDGRRKMKSNVRLYEASMQFPSTKTRTLIPMLFTLFASQRGQLSLQKEKKGRKQCPLPMILHSIYIFNSILSFHINSIQKNPNP